MLEKDERRVWCTDVEMKVCLALQCLCGRNTLATRLLCWVVDDFGSSINCIFIHHGITGVSWGSGVLNHPHCSSHCDI